MKKYIAVGIIILLSAHKAYAGFEISEIMYDVDGTDTNREWIEIHNTGATTDDLSKWYLFTDNTKHALVPEGVSMVEPDGYAVIAQNLPKFKADWPSFSGVLFDSSWTGLDNDGDTLALKDPDLTIVSQISFTSSLGAHDTGDSLQKNNDTWTAALPTPGALNQIGAAPKESSGTTPISLSTGSSSLATSSAKTAPLKKEKEKEIPKITTSIIASTHAVSGVALDISEKTTGLAKEQRVIGKYVWNFGDGETDIQTQSKQLSHVYVYPGEYVLMLEYYDYYYRLMPDATDRMIVKVIAPQASISSVGMQSDPYVEISNTSTYELALSGWMIKSPVSSFTVPIGTMLLPGKKIKFSPKVTHFTIADIGSLVLSNPSGDIVATYPLVLRATKHTSENTDHSSGIRSSRIHTAAGSSSKKESQTINLNDLQARAGSAHPDVSASSLAWIGLVGVTILGLVGVFFIHRNKKQSLDTIDDANEADIKIIE